jgi:hypothetical protein
MKYYWSIKSYDPSVYHWKARCPEGERIKAENRRTGNAPPVGHRPCEECPKVG